MRYTFGDCAFDTHLFTVQRAGQTRRLRPKVFQLLLYLVVHRDRVVSKPELCDQVWPGQFISEATLESHMRLVRQAIGDSGRTQRLIQTLYGHGYRFIGVVEEHDVALPAGAAQMTLALPRPMSEPECEETAATAVAASPSLEQPVRPSALQEAPVVLGADLGTSGYRQLTVLVCHLAEAPALAMRLEPEALHAVLRAYHATCTAVVARFGGYMAQSLGESLVAYFGFPQAHEDDARRAVQAGMALIEALEHGQSEVISTTVRVGIHTSPVVVVASQSEAQLAALAMGEAPQLAPHLARQAAPETVVVSAATWRLVAGWFVGESLEAQPLPGIPQPVPLCRILRASGAQSYLEAVGPERLTPLVGRTSEMAILQERWAQAREGWGQVVVLSGEAGIGKSRLAEVLRAQVAAAGYPQSVLHCSPYHTYSPLYPVIAHMQRLARWHREDPPAAKLDKLEQVLREYGLALEPMVPLLAALLSVPLLERYLPVRLTPQQQKQQTHAALVTWLRAVAERQPILLVWEDLHWADPSTLDLLSLWINQVPTMRVLTLLLYRPELCPPWTAHAHCSQLTLSRFTRSQVEQMLAYLTRDQPLPEAVREQVIARADGVPLFIEELVKMLLEAARQPADTGHNGRTTQRPLLVIPPTLQDALMARLDRLESARDLAQIGATWGREFTCVQLQALVPLEDTTLQQRLGELVEAEILYQRGLPPLASYRFKHVLIQEAAYQSLLQSTRQQYHQRIAQVLESRMPETVETQPELVAHHYTEAGCTEQAIPYWQRAGERAAQRAADLEAVSHFSTGLALLQTLPNLSEWAQQELGLQTGLGWALMRIRGYAAPEVQHAYARARELCRQTGETPQLIPTLRGLAIFYMNRAQLAMAQELVEQLLDLAHRQHNREPYLLGHYLLGLIAYHRGEFRTAHTLLHDSMALYDPVQTSAPPLPYEQSMALRVICLSHAAWVSCLMGYAEQARSQSHEALALAERFPHPFRLTDARYWASQLQQFGREPARAYELAEAVLMLATQQELAQQAAQGMFLRGWALMEQGQSAAGLAQMQQGFDTWQATGAEVLRPYYLALLAEALGKVGKPAEGLRLLTEALEAVDCSGERSWAAEVHRLKGELLLRQADRALLQSAATEEAEAWLHRAIAIARRQEAKVLELRAAMSLARLWKQQGKRTEAQELLAPIYGWFTEGFDTADLQEARALLKTLCV